jgi:eukaryotic-like serine/threonine-protein kinase
VAQLANVLMLVLVVVTVLAVAIAMYFVANWFARPIRELSDAMREIGKGRFDHRIAQQRNDEFGLLYTAFDQMAQQLADRQSGASPPTQAPAAAASEPDTDSTEGLSQPSDEPTQPRTLVAARSGARTDAPGDLR